MERSVLAEFASCCTNLRCLCRGSENSSMRWKSITDIRIAHLLCLVHLTFSPLPPTSAFTIRLFQASFPSHHGFNSETQPPQPKLRFADIVLVQHPIYSPIPTVLHAQSFHNFVGSKTTDLVLISPASIFSTS